jgi:hypothetical protein
MSSWTEPMPEECPLSDPQANKQTAIDFYELMAVTTHSCRHANVDHLRSGVSDPWLGAQRASDLVSLRDLRSGSKHDQEPRDQRHVLRWSRLRADLSVGPERLEYGRRQHLELHLNLKALRLDLIRMGVVTSR